MKKMNWLGLILTLVMCLAMVPAQAETYTAEEIKYDSVSSPYSNDELFAAYVEREMYRPIYGDTSAFGVLAKDKLDTTAKKEMYDALKAMIEEVAKGNRESTVISFDAEALKEFTGLQTNFEAAELGLASLGSGGNFTEEAKTKAMEAFSAQLLDGLLEALLHDCPYDLYWFDKAVDRAMSMKFSLSGTSQNIQVVGCTISFQVANGYGSETTVDISQTGGAAAASAKAQAIVDQHASKSDLEKLDAYRQEICDLVSYNDDAAKDDYTGGYGNPWQLIWVFDGDSSTNVVCEGYSKAFQYLCDLSEFDEKIYCYSVSGEMAGGEGEGRHMWNIVQTPSGNYLVDVTNCDTGTIGATKELFMKAQATGSWNTQYTLTPNGKTIIYAYDDDVEAMWGEEVLKLGENHTHDWKVNKAEWSLSNNIPTSCQKTRYCECDETETANAVSINPVVSKEATCTEPGQVTYTATFAEAWAVSETYVVESEKDRNNHTGETELRGKVDATCNQNGYTGDEICVDCGDVLVEGSIIPQGKHNYSVEVPDTRTDATCMAEGSVTMKCSGCDATEVQTLLIDPDNHTKQNTTVRDAASETCGADGYTGDTYCECGKKIADGQTIPATGAHVYGNPEYKWADDFSACTATGSCSGCDAEVTISAAISENTTEPTCGADGKKIVTATFADTWASQQKKEITLSATGEHVYGDVTYDWTNGFTGCTASRACGCGRTEEAEANVSFETTKAATCAAEGEKTYTAAFNKDWATTQYQTKSIEKNPANHTGETELRDAKEATCDNDGYTGNTYCLGCKTMIEEGKVVSATGEHVYVDPVYDWTDDFSGCTATAACGCGKTAEETVATASTSRKATCSEPGEILYTAEFEAEWADTQTKTKSLEKDPANHTGETELRDAKDATCGADGYTGDTYCLGCDEKLEEGEVTSATGEHNYADEVPDTRVPATCMSAGSVTMKCTGCTDTEVQTLPVDSDNHTGNNTTTNAKDATCGEAGYTGDTYCECGGLLENGETIPATGEHDFASEVEGTRVPATCIATGSVTMQCANCEATQEQTLEIDPDNHTGNTELREASEATCGKPGYSGDTYCVDCGVKLLEGDFIAPTGRHNYSLRQELLPGTCTSKGVALLSCSGCFVAKQSEDIPIDPDNHLFVEVINKKDATCGEDGYTGDTYCDSCKKTIQPGEVIPATGEHQYTVEVEGSRTDATCMAEGKVTMKCSGCGDTQEKTLEINRLNHTGNSHIENAREATCGEDGYTGDAVCECDATVKKGEVIPATGEHQYTVEVEGSRVPSTCGVAGKLTMKCANCTSTQDQELELDPENHSGGTEVRGAKEATCAADGYTGDTYCLGCEKKIETGEPISATGEHKHIIEVEGSRVPATCKTQGSVVMKCNGCNDTKTEVLPLDPANHEGGTELRGAKEATCFEDGYTGDLYCLGCETVLEEGEAIPAGHVDEDRDGVCDNCPTVLMFSIKILPSEGGAMSVSSEMAAAGDEVIITLMPDAGMEMEAVLVRLEDGTTITPRLMADTHYVYTQPAGDVTVEAFFKASPATVTFHANGGVGVMMPVQMTAGQPYTLPECAFLPAEGYVFKGWALTADGAVLPQTVTVGGNIDLYAIWQAGGPGVPVPPATGDSANLALWTVLMALSAAGVIWLLKPRKHKA